MLETLRILVSLSLVLLLAYWSLRVLLPRLQTGAVPTSAVPCGSWIDYRWVCEATCV